MRVNRLRNLLKDDKMSVGTHVHSTWPGIVEVIGQTGVFDYVEFTAEYAPYTLYDFENMARAAELFGMAMMIKVDRSLQTYLAQRAIGAGIQNVLFTDCRSLADVRESVASVRADTPETAGSLGCTMRRHVGYMLECGSEDYVKSLEEAVVAVMVEKEALFPALDEVLAVEGLDMVQFGPCDYAMSIGQPGRWLDAKVRSTEEEIVRKALKNRVAPRAEVNSVEEAIRYMDMGVRHFCLGSELVVLYEWLSENGARLREQLKRYI